MIAALLLIPLTMLVSALQGHNSLRKGWIIAAHVITVCTISLLAGLPILYALAGGVVLPLLFWCLLRRGKQANAEMKAMEFPADWRLGDVARSHFPHLCATLVLLAIGAVLGAHTQAIYGAIASLLAFPLPLLALMRYNYGTKRGNRLKNNGKFIDCRRPTEIAVGLSAGIQHAAIVMMAWAAF